MELTVSVSRSACTATFVDQELAALGERKDAALRSADAALTVLRKSSALWKDFVNAHGRAVVTLAQVDAKLVQLELLDHTDGDRAPDNDLGSLQVDDDRSRSEGVLEALD